MNKFSLKFVALSFGCLWAFSSHAQITNTITVEANFSSTTINAQDVESVPVIQAAPELKITKTASAPEIGNGKPDRADAGDTIKYTFEITNTGNTTIKDVSPVDDGPTFGGHAGTGSLSAFTLVGNTPDLFKIDLTPNATATFEAIYTMSQLDVYHAADTINLADPDKSLVENIAYAAGKSVSGTSFQDPKPDEASVEIPFFPELSLVKSAILNDEEIADGFAQLNETITYTYTVTNSGNVPLTDISVADVHEGTSLTAGTDIVSEQLLSEGPLAAGPTGAVSMDDGTANNAIWGILQPGAVATFTYIHTVTQDEVDDG